MSLTSIASSMILQTQPAEGAGAAGSGPAKQGISEWFNWMYQNNSRENLLAALVAAAALAAVLLLLQKVFARRFEKFARRTTNVLDDLVAELLKSTSIFFIIALAICVGSLALNFPEEETPLRGKVVMVLFLFQGLLWGNKLITFLINHYVRGKGEVDTSKATKLPILNFGARLVLWSLIILLMLANLGVDVTALVAGLGIGGVAIALALQSVLGDMFASLSIVLDKPFEVGDFIIVDEHSGTVEHIGMKTTRMRSLFGEQIIFSNSDLLKSRVRNFKRMQERRVVFVIAVTYRTPHEKLQAIPGVIREIIESQQKVRFDRAHFKEYGSFSLNFEVVYYILSSDYNLYMDVQQAINLELRRRFDREGIEFAYPTQTIYLNQREQKN